MPNSVVLVPVLYETYYRIICTIYFYGPMNGNMLGKALNRTLYCKSRKYTTLLINERVVDAVLGPADCGNFCYKLWMIRRLFCAMNPYFMRDSCQFWQKSFVTVFALPPSFICLIMTKWFSSLSFRVENFRTFWTLKFSYLISIVMFACLFIKGFRHTWQIFFCIFDVFPVCKLS